MSVSYISSHGAYDSYYPKEQLSSSNNLSASRFAALKIRVISRHVNRVDCIVLLWYASNHLHDGDRSKFIHIVIIQWTYTECALNKNENKPGTPNNCMYFISQKKVEKMPLWKPMKKWTSKYLDELQSADLFFYENFDNIYIFCGQYYQKFSWQTRFSQKSFRYFTKNWASISCRVIIDSE